MMMKKKCDRRESSDSGSVKTCMYSAGRVKSLREEVGPSEKRKVFQRDDADPTSFSPRRVPGLRPRPLRTAPHTPTQSAAGRPPRAASGSRPRHDHCRPERTRVRAGVCRQAPAQGKPGWAAPQPRRPGRIEPDDGASLRAGGGREPPRVARRRRPADRTHPAFLKRPRRLQARAQEGDCCATAWPASCRSTSAPGAGSWKPALGEGAGEAEPGAVRTVATNRSAASVQPGTGRGTRRRGEGVGWARRGSGRSSATNQRAASGRPGAGRAPRGGVGTAPLRASWSRGPDPATYGSEQDKTSPSCPPRVGGRRRAPTAAFLPADFKCSTVDHVRKELETQGTGSLSPRL
ncbi:uncharacterized protein LOC144580652 [Callithrix jacchus]